MTSASAVLDISPGDRVPIYRQRELRTREAIVAGRVRLGERLTPWQEESPRLTLDRWIDGLIGRLHEASGRDLLSVEPLEDDWTAVALEALPCSRCN